MNQLTLTECSKRKLDETYLVVYAIKNEINIKKGDYIEKRILSRSKLWEAFEFSTSVALLLI